MKYNEVLNKEYIMKAVHHCVDGAGCSDCPYEFAPDCASIEELLCYIKELTEENERLVKQCGELIIECDGRDAARLEQIAELIKENKELKADLAEAEAEYDRVYEQAEADIRGNMADGGTSCHWCIAGHRADTIREMRDRLSDKALDKYPYVGYIDVFDMEDVAKEMLEENNV